MIIRDLQRHDAVHKASDGNNLSGPESVYSPVAIAAASLWAAGDHVISWFGCWFLLSLAYDFKLVQFYHISTTAITKYTEKSKIFVCTFLPCLCFQPFLLTAGRVQTNAETWLEHHSRAHEILHRLLSKCNKPLLFRVNHRSSRFYFARYLAKGLFLDLLIS